jgi:4-phospho-D-threonate 3-dehydrogenase / 4-phospho-D-erythronate 3-dehydrogenase
MKDKPVIGITMGDPAGIGPEIIVKALAGKTVSDLCRAVVIGDRARLVQAARICGIQLDFKVIQTPTDARDDAIAYVIDLGGLPADLPFGQLSPTAGDAAYRYIAKAAEFALDGSIDAICTAPLNKEALHAAGHNYPGHTEMLAALTRVPEVSMLLRGERLNVIHVTTHIGLIDAVELIDSALILRTIRRGHRTMVESGIDNPKVAVCGINPHAGENGLFGRGEEESKIVPAVTEAVAEGMDVYGPLPADTVFFRAGRGDFDLVVAMYHDQGHGPVKVLGLDVGVNVTVGLPVVRTSVDHGTAFDIAGTGRADEASLLEALRQAVTFAASRHRSAEGARQP